MTLCFSLKSFGFGFCYSQSPNIAGLSHHIALLVEYHCLGACLFRVPFKGPYLAPHDKLILGSETGAVLTGSSGRT